MFVDGMSFSFQARPGGRLVFQLSSVALCSFASWFKSKLLLSPVCCY
jgi:hypothetical protein